MELRHYFAILRRRAALVLLTVVAAVVVAWVVTPKTHKYSAQSVIYVGARQFSVSPGAQYSFDPTLLVERLMQTYAKMLDSEPIATDAVHATAVPRTPKQVVKESQVTPGSDTQLLTVAVTDRVPAVAQRLANGIADAFIQKAQTLDAQPGPGSLPSLPAYIFQRADLPTTPVSTGLLRNVVLAGFFGLLVSVGLVFLLDYLDLTLKSTTEAEDRLQLPVLGFIPYSADHAARALTSSVDISASTQLPDEDPRRRERTPVKVKVRLGPARAKSREA